MELGANPKRSRHCEDFKVKPDYFFEYSHIYSTSDGLC